MDIQAQPGRDPAAECQLARAVRSWPGAETVPAFGASDCHCDSHLAWFARRPGGSVRATEVLARLPEFCALLAQDATDYTAQPRDAFRTLVTCLLSLRTRDPVTAAASGRLLARWPHAPALARADAAELAGCIFPVGMYRQKARGMIRLARLLEEDHGGLVPRDLDGLLALPGVGRKTANLVLSFAFHQPAICVDTHVHRIGNRWGLVRTAAPDDSERELRAILPQEYWLRLNPYLVQHGQRICLPRRPRCSRCRLVSGCAYAALRAERDVLECVPAAPPHPCLGAVLPVG